MLTPEREAILRDGNYVHADVLALLDALSEAQRLARAADGYQRDAFEEVDRLKAALATARAEGRAEGMEAAAGEVSERADLLRRANRKSCASEMDLAVLAIRALAASEATR